MRRLRRLVLSSIVTVGNYEYGFFWYLYQDASIEFEVKLTGVLSTGAVPTGETPQPRRRRRARLYGPNHQHFFCVRLDMDVDGPANTVVEVNSEASPPGQENPYGNAWIAKPTPLRREAEAQRSLDLASARYWRITNPNRLNELGEPVAYRSGARRERTPLPSRGLADPAARPLRDQPSLGHPLPPGGALRRRRLPEPEPRPRRVAAMGQG